MITFACAACQKKLSVKDDLAGQPGKCPDCGQVVCIPARVASAFIIESTVAPQPGQNDQKQFDHGEDMARGLSSNATVAVARPDADPSLTDFLAPPRADDELGRLGKYRILDILGHGGMGVVFKAEDPVLKRGVAIKAILPKLVTSANAGQRFLLEAQSMAALEHDHVVRIYQVDEDRGVPFLAMEFLKGESLAARLRRENALTVSEVLRIGREIAEGLAAAHATGLIHRDIKHSNIWLESPKNRVKILDFGLARAMWQPSRLTQSGALVGTPAFMSPEQSRGVPVDARCDLFSLGVVLYRLCTGRQPFTGSDVASILQAVLTDQPPPPGQVNSTLPQGLSDLVMNLLEKEPERRPASAGVVVEMLRTLELKCARQAGERDGTLLLQAQAGRPGRRRRWPGLILAAVLLVGLIGVAAFTLIRLQGSQDDSLEDDSSPITLADGNTRDKETPRPSEDDWLKKVASLPAGKQVEAVAEKLKERNPGFNGKVTPWVDAGVVTGLELRTSKVTDLSPLRALPGLRTLKCLDTFNRRGNLADLSPLEGMKLTLVYCHFTNVKTLSPLAGMKLTQLNCGYTEVKDLSPLKGMKLRHLYLSGSKVSDLSPLKGMHLTTLHCQETKVQDLSPLAGMKLKFLECWGTKVTDLSPLRGMPLKEIDCDFKSERDTEILRSTKTLEKINGKPVKDFWKKEASRR